MDGLFITGTGTEVGKTIVTALLALGLRKQGLNACPVKPVASGGVIEQGEYVSTDAQVYRRFSGVYETASRLNPVCFKHPASPHLAAQMARQTIDPEILRNSLNRLAKKYDILLVEGVGGWLVPLTFYYKVADFARDLRLPVLLVSANRLGSINHTLLTLESIRFRGIKPAGVIMTNPQPVSDAAIVENNIETIERVGQVDI
ncbi:MAG: dethiobiotin synthase [Candidatus Omnitrophica bacterium]|nr:dethiobiotin synthase [Candidatus Omnitrophota bacterium]